MYWKTTPVRAQLPLRLCGRAKTRYHLAPRNTGPGILPEQHRRHAGDIDTSSRFGLTSRYAEPRCQRRPHLPFSHPHPRAHPHPDGQDGASRLPYRERERHIERSDAPASVSDKSVELPAPAFRFLLLPNPRHPQQASCPSYISLGPHTISTSTITIQAP
ncbi:hypothetical protein K438DRAFT_2024172 [Mycena galopus ATCC 62051]|nr:hypothetical protein K438DRAFT_2024172 [Mycena galopus ATCC 62051]